MILRILFLASLLGVGVATSSAQVRFRVAAGMSTDWITNDNPAAERMVGDAQVADSLVPLGGSLDGMQAGWGIRGYADLDKQKYFRIPIGLDYWMYDGTQTVQDYLSGTQIRHQVDIISTMIGFEWSFAEFPMAYARAYVGGEIRPTFIGANQVTYHSWNRASSVDYDSTDVFSLKEACTRVGAMLRLGVEGELYYPVFINTSVAWGVMNLIGRDTRPTWEGGRGELLTVSKLNEGGESYVQHLNFTFMIQVRL